MNFTPDDLNQHFLAVADNKWMCLSKAFNCVNHDALLLKLACYIGVVDNSLVWFASYLSCHWQRVCLQGLTSEWGVIHAGVLEIHSGSFIAQYII